MKWTEMTFDISKWRKVMQQLVQGAKFFALVAVGTFMIYS